MNNKLYVVSGTARSGTSLMMNILRDGLGSDGLIGVKFPQEEMYKIQGDLETDAEYNYRIYIHENRPEFKKELNASRKMNPMGFWEDVSFTVSGLYFHPSKKKSIDKINACKVQPYAKLEARGLPVTDPNYLDKVVFMLRNPHEVAKSQEDLKRKGKYHLEDGTELDIFGSMKINTPEMFISTNIACAKWFIDNPEVKVKIILYDDLLADPASTVQAVGKFLEDGDFSNAHNVVRKKLRRSTDFTNEYDLNGLWDEAEIIYEHMMKGEFQAILDFANNNEREFNKISKHWLCARYNSRAFYKTCEECTSNKDFRDNVLRADAIKNGVDWENKPCAYECAYRNKDLISIEESIKNNFWK